MTPVAELSKDDTIAHYNAVLIEHLDSKFDLLIEGFQAFKAEVRSEISAFRNEVYARFDIVEAAIKCNAQAIRELQTDMREVKADIKDLQSDMKEVKIGLRGINNRLDDHEDRITCLDGSRA